MRLFLYTLGFTIFLFGCASPKTDGNKQVQQLQAKGGKRYGGIFRMSETEYIKSLFPPSIVDVYSYRVAANIYEGLLKFNPHDITKLEGGIAETWEVDETGTIYTFHLRKGVRFHPDACFANGADREVTAEDIRFCFSWLCRPHHLNQNFHLFKDLVVGANEYFALTEQEAADTQPAGFEVVDRYTFRIRLKKPRSTFLYNLARPGAMVFPQEAWEAYGGQMRIKAIGTGPFTIGQVQEGIEIFLQKNEAYYLEDSLGNALPFLDGLHIRFVKDKKMEWFEFKKGNLDMIYRLPPDRTMEIMDEVYSMEGKGPQYTVQRQPEMSTQCIVFNNFSGVFMNADLRKAFSFAINKKKILNYVLNGEGYDIGKYGFTPPCFANYPTGEIDGYTFHLDSARHYLQKAGYPNGQGLPAITLTLNVEGDRYQNLAIELQKQLKDHLNVQLEIEVVPMAQLTERVLSGNFDLMRLAWIADYPSPENYLWKFYSRDIPSNPEDPSYPNFTRYINTEFDKFYEKALNSIVEEEAIAYFKEAEQLLMEEAPLIVLWYDESYRLLQQHVYDFANNPMQYRDFSKVYLKKENTTVQ